MKAAVSAVEDGSSLKKAAKDFSVPRSTLLRKLKSKQQGQPVTKSLGRTPALNTGQELELVDLILELEAFFWSDTSRCPRSCLSILRK